VNTGQTKKQLLSPERYAERANDFYGQTVARVYPAYEKRMRECNALDFDDLLYFPALALKNDAELRAELERSRELLEEAGPIDPALHLAMDYDMWLRLSAHYQFDFVERATMHYRIWGGQMSKDYRARYETGIRTMQRFLDKNPDTVDRAMVRSAWAHTYTGRGNITLWRAHDRLHALRDYLLALSFRPGYWPAWRAILRSFITTRAKISAISSTWIGARIVSL